MKSHYNQLHICLEGANVLARARWFLSEYFVASKYSLGLSETIDGFGLNKVNNFDRKKK